MSQRTNNRQAGPTQARIGYIASHIYRLTFEINEVAELIRQRPDTRVYSFYRRRGSEAIQTKRVADIPADIISPSWWPVLRSFCGFCVRSPAALIKCAVLLMWHSKSNPVYWLKNFAVFFVALPILADARRHGVTHLHADFGSSPATIAWMGKKMLGTGLSIRYHSFDIHHQGMAWRDPMRRQKLRDADVVIAVHYDGLSHLKQMVPDVDSGKFKMIRICVVFEPEPRKREPSAAPLLVAAGNLVPAKGFELLVEAAGLLKRRGKDVRIRILGEGPQRANLTSIAERNGVSDRVEMPGYYQHFELAQHLAEAVALVTPPRITKSGLREGLPSVIVEAWLSKTAVIASPIGGIPEVVEDGKTGLVFPAGNAEALADCIVRVIDEPALGRAIANEGYGVAVSLFSPEKNVRALLEEIDACGREPLT